MSLNPPEPVELTRDFTEQMRERASDGALVAEYVLRNGAPAWVTVSCEGVIANVPEVIVEDDPHRPGHFRIRSGIEQEMD